MKRIAFLPHVHKNVAFRTAKEHNEALIEGAIRCLTQLHERNQANVTPGYCHFIEALIDGIGSLRKGNE